MSIFTCCTCPEPPDYDSGVDDPLPTYFSACDCPSVSITCVSQNKVSGNSASAFEVSLCGTSDPSETTEPVKIYQKRKTIFPCSGDTGEVLTVIYSYADNGGCTSEANYTFPACDGTSETRSEYSNPTDDAGALSLARTVSGSDCSSIYEARTDKSFFRHQTVKYTATAQNLVIGVEYEGCVRIKRREAYSTTVPSGGNTDWEDIEPDTIVSFIATNTEEEVATDEALPFAKGYEYLVVEAYLWPVSAGCDCPTSYVSP